MNEYESNRTDYEPNFILRPAAKEPSAEEPLKAERTAAEDPLKSEHLATGHSAADRPITETLHQEQTRQETSDKEDSPAAEVLKAAAAKAEALKAAAAKVDPSMEPYRRETSDLEDPIYRGMPVDDRAVNGAAQSETSRISFDNTLRDTHDVAAGTAPGSTTGAGFGAAAGTAPGSTAGRAQSGTASSRFGGAAGGAGIAGRARAERPTFENPSFDPGKTGNFRDPREQFRPDASASWSNGEVRRSRKQVRDSIHKQAKQKKAAKPVTLTRRGLAFLVAGCMCLSCLFGFGGSVLGNSLYQQDQAETAQTTTAAASSAKNDSTATSAGYTLENATGSNMTIKEITNATQNSVVEIRTESVASDSWMQEYVTEGAGSGVIISDDGYIMTNNHVIEGASKIKVTTADEKEYDATLVGTDESNDVAVIKINAKGLTPATYGNSDQLEVGDMAVVIGNPLGQLGGTVTAGIISATDRELSIDGKTLHLLQTDSSINPGNSGGGMFDGSGHLIGLVVAKSAGSDVEGLGFAIPINTAADVAKQLIDKGYVSGQPSTGMTYQEGAASNGSGDSFSTFDSFFGGSASGVYIYSVNGENAKKAGFQPGDQVFAVDGEEITTFDDLSSIVTAHKVGDQLTFTIIRDGTQKNIKLKLEEKAASSQNSNEPAEGGQSQPGSDQNEQGQPDQNPNNNIGGWQEWFNSFF